MNKKSTIAKIGIVLAISAFTLSAMPGGGFGPHGRHGGGGPGIMKMLDRIPDLTDDQEKEIYAVLDPVRSEMRKARSEVGRLQREIHELTFDGADEQTVYQKIDELADKKAALMKKRFTLHKEIIQILTEEQKKVLSEKKIRRSGKKRKR